MGVSRKSWKPGCVWIGVNDHGYKMEVIIIGPPENNKKLYKYAQIQYLEGPCALDLPIQSDYSHSHITRYFHPTEEIREIPEKIDYEKEIKF